MILHQSRKQIAERIASRLKEEKERLANEFASTRSDIGYFALDDVLSEKFVKQIYSSFPIVSETVQKKSIRESKYVGYQMNKFDPILEELIYSFQEPEIVDVISEICQIPKLEPDEYLYAGGISLMKHKNFLNPHLDNSHDKDRNKWRVLNLLYYVTPDWQLENGGNLELWPDGVKEDPITITSKFNRLVVMATHQKSWHSVSPVNVEKVRCCVSNYYFSEQPLLDSDTFHVTTFTGRPEEKTKSILLKADGILRGGLRKIFKKGIKENKHQYKKD